ncbi:MAG: hypothetical protein JW913_07590 [Chitinispirillaceae bacterium]|nr:hypothetical protein [Chitinispirillaceae bacterium]
MEVGGNAWGKNQDAREREIHNRNIKRNKQIEKVLLENLNNAFYQRTIDNFNFIESHSLKYFTMVATIALHRQNSIKKGQL